MTTLSIFKNFPDSKYDLKVAQQNIIDDILAGNFNPLEVDIKLKKIELLIEGIRKNPEIKEAIQNELSKYPEKSPELFGVRCTKTSRSAWNYTGCNDSYLQELEKTATEVADQMTERKKLLQVCKSDSLVNALTGEFIVPATKTIADGYSITLL